MSASSASSTHRNDIVDSISSPYINLTSNLQTTANSTSPDNEQKPNRFWMSERDAIMVGPCDHTWLFQNVCAVVHHGGAGKVNPFTIKVLDNEL